MYINYSNLPGQLYWYSVSHRILVIQVKEPIEYTGEVGGLPKIPKHTNAWETSLFPRNNGVQYKQVRLFHQGISTTVLGFV